jgi:hypothetical protein
MFSTSKRRQIMTRSLHRCHVLKSAKPIPLGAPEDFSGTGVNQGRQCVSGLQPETREGVPEMALLAVILAMVRAS